MYIIIIINCNIIIVFNIININNKFSMLIVCAIEEYK